ncbi:hypothetical protein JRO89_XS12G0013000 [Xanthoceras sorbifolium]|uniref:phosphatidate phosphatase n=1 Tax=Xanthoceras sorbifolium TaxID=99658 RepID=A0ABQ8HAC9_9ROSI|nr:hypothetical protein JRO89_XS12G0013000 [Xanthoceras sorbifolium]
MNVVGKVGSLISQGVYSVATPFHPFGGAVDVIVVQQQDGTFRSTPWYVRFGKFQGVLKGAEKVVHITVNGVEANFHMYLDNSGEAYFVKEVDCAKSSETNGSMGVTGEDSCLVDSNGDNKTIPVHRLEHSVSDSGVAQMRDESASFSADRLQRAESEGERRFYEFQDDQSSLEGSVELSDYGSNQYESLDGERYGESQRLDSEVVLVSVDGHVLTAPVLASEQNTENVQLSTPQFHLGPGDGADFCAGNGEFSSGDDVWADDYISKLNTSTADVANDNVCTINGDGVASGHQLEVCEGEEEHSCDAHEAQNISISKGDLKEGEEESVCQGHKIPNVAIKEGEAKNICQPLEIRKVVFKEGDLEIRTNAGKNKKEDVFKSCLELTELDKHFGNADSEEMGSSSEVHDSQEKSLENPLIVNKAEDVGAVYKNDDASAPLRSAGSPGNDSSPGRLLEEEPIENIMLDDTEKIVSDCKSVDSVITVSERKNEEQFGSSPTVEEMDHGLERSMSEDECSKSDSLEPPLATPTEGTPTHSGSRFEISLCGNEFRAGMGLDAATEAFDAHRISEDEFRSTAASIIKNENLIIRYQERYLSWEKAAPIVLGMAAFGVELPVEQKDAIPVEQEDTLKGKDDDSGITTPSSSGRRWRLWPIPFRKVKTLEHTDSNASSDDIFVDTEPGLPNSQFESSPQSDGNYESPRKQIIRTNVPTTEQIASLNLKDGQNMITFSFSTRVLGMQQVDAHIYLWKWNARIVISDVDGTITKSDVLGQFMPLVGKDWTQSGVAKLFSAIKENGYQLLFLSARAIVQAYLTRSFLLNLKQDGKALPNGPIVISPDGLFPSLYREVIRRAPHEFKIACLEDIKKLFPSDYNPFYAGFGNRDTDELSYRKIGIPKGKIFIINPKGEVAISHRIDVKSYTSLHTLVNDMFPPTLLVEQEDYNSWNFWKVPIPDVEI